MKTTGPSIVHINSTSSRPCGISTTIYRLWGDTAGLLSGTGHRDDTPVLWDCVQCEGVVEAICEHEHRTQECVQEKEEQAIGTIVYKLMNNAIYGKFLQNVMKQTELLMELKASPKEFFERVRKEGKMCAVMGEVTHHTSHIFPSFLSLSKNSLGLAFSSRRSSVWLIHLNSL